MIYDISVPISVETPVWPGDTGVRLEATRLIREGDKCNLTRISMGTHTGTHIDAPLHFIEGGDSIDRIPLEIFIGSCAVVEPNVKNVIERTDLERIDLLDQGRVLIKTTNSFLWERKTFQKDYSTLGESAAAFLIEQEIILVGIDYLSVEGLHASENPVHKILLGEGIIILEGLNLSDIEPGIYELICLPLKLLGSDGSPVRALLRDIGDS